MLIAYMRMGFFVQQASNLQKLGMLDLGAVDVLSNLRVMLETFTFRKVEMLLDVFERTQ
jgi:hypothetical protein